MTKTKLFETPDFPEALAELMRWRRDVRRFRRQPLDESLVRQLLNAATLAPSVGLSQAWRFVRVRSQGMRKAVRANFEHSNAEALGGYSGDDAKLYARLKLAALDHAPEQIAVFSDQATDVGRGLGRRSMPEMLDYSVVGAVQHLWLAARAEGVGVGWVSILDPGELTRSLDVPVAYRFIAYLCIGWPEEESVQPELERLGWERRRRLEDFVLER